jgi:hypothetical protein
MIATKIIFATRIIQIQQFGLLVNFKYFHCKLWIIIGYAYLLLKYYFVYSNRIPMSQGNCLETPHIM